MQNKWTIYSFLTLMITALITLAVLQYNWLGSVSEGEKKRLQENLEASSENFISDLNRDFSALNRVFKIQITKADTDFGSMLNDSYIKWISNTKYPELIDSVYFVRNANSETPIVSLFQTDPVRLNEIENYETVKKWLYKKPKTPIHQPPSFDLLNSTDFGDPTFMSVPLQLLDLVTLENENLGRNLKVSLNVDQSNDIVLLQLDDEVIKNKMIPDIARTYFSESYDDQYHISIIKQGEVEEQTEFIYFTTAKNEEIPAPDLKKDLRNFDFTSVFVLKTDEFNPLITELDSLKGSMQSIQIKNENSAKRIDLATESTKMSYRTITKDSVFTAKRDTVINTSFSADFSTAGWQFWLSFKEGSLDAFVNKTKNRNLMISFGILLVLGFCVGMIVMFSKRSQDLAEKQMLFMAGVSHELRTPLTVIRSAAENLNEGVIQNEERKKEYARLMLKEGKRLSDMVDQIMEFSGIQSGRKIYQFSEFKISEFIEEINHESKTLLEREGLTLEYSINTNSATLYADREAVFLAVGNLIQNAIKFSNGSERISLKVDEIEFKRSNSIRFQVTDHGIGISEEEQKQIFEPFFRGKKPVEDQVKGNGIGLSLVQKVAVAHHGDIQVKSSSGKGSVFSLIIPQSKNKDHA